MKRLLQTSALLAAALAATVGTSQAAVSPSAPLQTRKPVTLKVVQSTFQRLDGNSDKSVSLSEAIQAKVSTSLFNKHDSDGSRGLNTDEFAVLYKELLVKAKRPVSRDLNNEVARIEAARRAEAEARRTGQALEEGAAPPRP